jgi:PAS domain S-box-containing protein
MKRFARYFNKQPRGLLLALSFLLVLAIGTIDSLTGPELSLSAFYLIPIFIATSYVGLLAGVVVSAASVVVYLLADHILSISYSRSALPYWNSTVRLLFFLAVTYVLAKRKYAEDQLSQSEERFRLLVEGVKDYAILMLDREGNINSWNKGAERIYGYSSGEILGRHISSFYLPAEQEQSKPQRDLEQAAEHGKHVEEGWRLRKDRSHFWADVMITPLPRGFSMLTRDMTERKKAEEAVHVFAELHEIDRAILAASSSEAVARESLMRIHNLIPFAQASVTLFDFELDQAIMLVSWGTSAAHGEAHFVLESADLEQIDRFQKGELHMIADTRVADSLPFRSALTLQGIRCYANVPLLSQNRLIGSLNLGMASPEAFEPKHLDIAREVANQLAIALQNVHLFEQVRDAHHRLQLLSRRLLEVQETERRHLARELHDEMGQSLTVVRIHLEEMESALESPQLLPRLRESITIVEKILQQVRDLSLDLRPLMLDDLGLVAALRWYASRQAQLAGFAVHFTESLGQAHFSADLETTCFRIAQEALTNIVRHARAKRVNVELTRSGDWIHLLVKDDGCGFNLFEAQERASRGASLGLLGMRERVSLMNGIIEIESVPSSGTEIRVQFPAKPREEVLA